MEPVVPELPPPIVSVVIPVYRSERFVADTIRSVLAQTLADFELIVVDDGSPDRSIAICKAFTDPRIRYVHQGNGGLAAARNAGIRAARARYIAFLDSDDLWHPEKLARHAAHLDARPEVGLSYGYSVFIDELGERLGGYQMLGKERTRPVDCFVANPIGNGSNAVLRCAVFNGIRSPGGGPATPEGCLFDEELRQAEDFELWMRIGLQTSWKIECIPWPLTLYRVHAGSLSSNVTLQYKYHLRAIAKVAEYAPDLVSKYRAAGESNLFWYLARNLVIQGKVSQARRMAARALRKCPMRVGMYKALLLVYLVLTWMLPIDAHSTLLRSGQRIYGRCQEWLIKRRQRRVLREGIR